jgi:hypothetical protein
MKKKNDAKHQTKVFGGVWGSLFPKKVPQNVRRLQLDVASDYGTHFGDNFLQKVFPQTPFKDFWFAEALPRYFRRLKCCLVCILSVSVAAGKPRPVGACHPRGY